ncbi:FAD-dependent monooxygenase [Mucilaginibacter roseus]|uniref:FAD-dependent monooxygenase n=1 Tax=Mucilaginibacter roseus TaxID=1528868 RepID=A0ABS8U1N6_9SPHI|nr:FAD-dependent monooxygenase [Mucilaginibacter roseus]MCD8741019.1 FAD-dependent monooxygenase [Mucilaginibacter roseus]
MKNKKILITGASIAGPALAYWLNYYGFEVTVVERADELRLGGQNIDVKGPAREVIGKMGLEDAVRKANTTEIGIQFVNTENEVLAEFPKESSMSMTQDLEILRGDLVNILYEHTRNNVHYRFGDYVTAVAQAEDEMKVTFKSGKTEIFDMLIVAEGIGSGTRKLIFGDETRFKYLGLYTAYLTVKKQPTDSRWARWCNAPRGIVYILRPDNYGTTRASITMLAEENEYRGMNLSQLKQALIARIKGSGWESERLISEIEATDDLYLDRVSQVKASEWSKGRVVLVGDAAYCATPIAGKGTDLAIAGAYILAGELATALTHQAAFANYEKLMRPYAEKCQKLPPGIPGLVYPTSKFGVSVLNGFYRIFGSRPVKWLSSLGSNNKQQPKQEIELPDYNQADDALKVNSM